LATTSDPVARGPLRRPDVVARSMETDRTALGQVALDFYVAIQDGLLARYADATGAGAVPCHPAMFLREVAREYPLANRLPQMIFHPVHAVGPPASGVCSQGTRPRKSTRNGPPTGCALPVPPVTFSVPLPRVVIPVALLPSPLVSPLWAPILPPPRRMLAVPLIPMTGRDVVVLHRHHQDGPGHELRTNNHPRAVVPPADVPAPVGERPVLPAVEEKIDGSGRSRHVPHLRDLRHDDQLGRRGKVNADVHVHLGVDRRDEREHKQRDDQGGHE
jgi:hypothetical protein